MSSTRNQSGPAKRSKLEDPQQLANTLAQRTAVLVARILADGTLPERLPADGVLADLGINSLKLVNLMLATEAEFDIVIPQDDIKRENFQTITAIVTLVSRLEEGH